MASPDHKAGLAVVIPTSDSRSPAQRKSKQNALNVPRNKLSQLNGNTPARLMNANITPRQPFPASPARQSNGTPFGRQSTGVAPFQPPNRTLTTQPRLLNVDEALQFSPFSSIVPFGPGECFEILSCTVASDFSRCNTNPQHQSPWLSASIYYGKRAPHSLSAT